MSDRGRFDFRREVALGLCSYGAYLVVRRLVWNERGRARARYDAQRILGWERSMGIDIESKVQSAALRVPGMVPALNLGYAAGNVALSVGWLLLLYRRRDASFFRERRAALAAFAGALPFFAAMPTAPPRTLDEFVDTMNGDRFGLDHPLLLRFYNPIAAMPSHHVAFAVVTGVGLARRASSRSRRVGWATYPGAVALVVVATANHFVADVAGGAALGVLARRATR
ncbi:MAG: phosphatase PAP2 family protein [Actinobacteria bacterium]|nr:phosphatase PAP2 family protein [Actinomycetota bacterium]